MLGLRKLPLAIQLATLSLAAAGTAAVAQEERALEEVTVTAQKREQNLQEVPIAVSAISGDTLQQNVIKDVFDLQANTPGLTANRNQTNNTSNFAIRGIGTSGQNFGLESSVGMYVDGTYRARQSAMINNMVDMEAVEVLRGPQGTLFGKNTAAGAVQFRTKAPSHETDGFVEVNAGNYGLINTAGAANVSLIEDVLAVRATGFTSERDGYVDVAGVGSDVLNSRDRWGVRLQALYTPNDDLSVRIIADQSEIDEICCAALTVQDSLSVISPIDGSMVPGSDAVIAGLGGTVFDGDDYYDYRTASNVIPESSSMDAGISVDVQWDLSDSMRLTSITASREYESFDLIDADFSDVDMLDVTNDAELSSLSQELRLDFSGESFNAVVGAYYYEQEVKLDYLARSGTQFEAFASQALGYAPLLVGMDMVAAQTASLSGLDLFALGLTPAPGLAAFPDPAFPSSAPGFISNFSAPHIAEQAHQSWAVFGQFDYDLTDALTLTMGLRYTDEQKDLVSRFTEINPDGTPWIPVTPPGSPAAAGAALGDLAANLAAGNPAQLLDPVFMAQFEPFSNPGWAHYLFAGLAPRPDIDTTLEDEQITGTIKLSYALDENTMVYGSYGTGYKSGGTNTDRIANGFDPLFDAETSQTAEVGLKAEFPEQALRMNIALHVTEIDDFQANAFTGDGFNLQNAGSMESYGGEAEIFWQPAAETTVTATYAYTDATYKSFERGTCWVATPAQTGQPDPGASPGLPFCDRSGDEVSMSPDHTLTLGMRQDFSLSSDVDGYVMGEYNYRSEMVGDGNADPLKTLDSLGLFNARAGVTFNSLDMDMTLWARNLTDEGHRYITFDVPIQAGKLMAYPGEPRTYGLSVNKRF
ncbi:TonB-dependent receptor [Biformimicrobium ophioploci]|uniref:TonB-dependent receptor n=1 Tax=Biformimicrobium ophioploci TaxID=3036711 RepID=A0ABQ6LW29_9GAMM|nr:TonB-dependent receptor [Microbulbifer sp. NKW57]GMG86232.1 TonB-dependent receptor [Microbulbifer sp. NKW57]